MATSFRFTATANRNGMGAKNPGVYNPCTCHPIQWGAKKAARRARRRISKQVILEGLKNQ